MSFVDGHNTKINNINKSMVLMNEINILNTWLNPQKRKKERKEPKERKKEKTIYILYLIYASEICIDLLIYTMNTIY